LNRIESTIEGLKWILHRDRFGFGENWQENDQPQAEEELAGYYITKAIKLLGEINDDWQRLN